MSTEMLGEMMMAEGVRKIVIRREKPLRRVRIRGLQDRKRIQEESTFSIRIAVYRADEGTPIIEDILSSDIGDLLARTAIRVYDLARSEGGTIPLAAIREIVENLLHAGCCDATVSVLNSGSTIAVSDRGCGIPDKETAQRPGFTSATAAMRRHIRGVGSGLVVARESMERIQGMIRLEDNVKGGAVITLDQAGRTASKEPPARQAPSSVMQGLSDRQKRVLVVVAEGGLVGPSIVAKEARISLATAHRDLNRLEERGLVQYAGKGKRSLTQEGNQQIQALFLQ